jgi:hypothetical protein
LAAYFLVASFYIMHVNFFALMSLPFVSLFLCQPPVNLDILDFVWRFGGLYIFQLVILIGFGQRYLLRPDIERGIWWRSGFVDIASAFYVVKAFLHALIGKELVRSKHVTSKDRSGGATFLRFFRPHLLFISAAILTGVLFFRYAGILWPVKGMLSFLLLSVVVISALITSASRVPAKLAMIWRTYVARK